MNARQVWQRSVPLSLLEIPQVKVREQRPMHQVIDLAERHAEHNRYRLSIVSFRLGPSAPRNRELPRK